MRADHCELATASGNRAAPKTTGYAPTTRDETARIGLLRQATELAVSDGGVIPLVFLDLAWAARAPRAYRSNPTGWTFAWDVRREGPIR